jgi:hypothetical protein
MKFSGQLMLLAIDRQKLKTPIIERGYTLFQLRIKPEPLLKKAACLIIKPIDDEINTETDQQIQKKDAKDVLFLCNTYVFISSQ